MKILISGASGFIGSHIAKQRKLLGDDVYAITRPSTNISGVPDCCKIFCFDGDVSKLDSFMKRNCFDGIVHLATHYLASHNTYEIKSLIDSNILLGTTLLDIASRNNVKWFINTSTFTQHYNDNEYFATNLYSATKQAFEDIGKFYADTGKIVVTNLSLFDTFGKNDSRRKIINILLDAARSGEELAMSPGDQIIDISHIDNVVHGFNLLIFHLSGENLMHFNGQTFALPSSDRMTLKELVALFSNIYGSNINVCFGKREYRPYEVMNPWSKCKILPGYKPVINLRDGIEKFIKESAK